MIQKISEALGLPEIFARCKKLFFTSMMVVLTLFFIHKNIIEEFSLFNLNDLNIELYGIFVVIILAIGLKVVGKWFIKPVIVSTLLFLISFAFSEDIATKLNDFNMHKVESYFTQKENRKNKNWLVLYHGLLPSVYHFNRDQEIMIYGLRGTFEIYDLSSGEWSIRD